jgi:cell wall-associated NlpC family hydrolase
MAEPASAGTAALKVVPQLVKTFSRDLVTQMTGPAQKGAAKTGQETGKRFGTSFTSGIRTGVGPLRTVFRGFGPQLAAAFGGAAIVGAIKSVTDEARESAKVGRQTQAVLKATGGVANVSAKDVDRLASSLMRTVAVDDEIIATGANMLLTFKNVRNEVGKGNNIFDQATAAAVDMTAAMNAGAVTQEGLQASTIRLGKALNDPLKGMTALQRVGVTFTQGQKDQIKALVESGRTMDAQRIILAELKSEFGGAAAAAVDPWQRVGVVLGEVKEQIGTALMPVLDSVALWLSETIPAAVATASTALRTLKDWWDDNKTSVETLTRILVDTFVPGVGESDTAVKDFTTSLGTLKNFLTDLAVFVLELTKIWLGLEHVTIGLISVYGSMTIAAGHVINAIDKLSGGTGHAGDQFVKFGRQVKDQATAELNAVRQAAKDAQAAIDRLHGKDVTITGTTTLQFTKTFTKQDWNAARLAAGRMAKGGLVRGPGGPTSDMVPAMLSAGEAVVPARLVPQIAPWLASEGIPGFANGGLATKIGQTGTAHAGVGKLMDRWGTLQLAALVKTLVGGAGSAAIKAFIRSTDRLPYIWGGAGPGGYDCSGLVSAVLGKMTGKGGGHGQRYFTTSSIRAGILGIKPGLGGTLQIGVTAGTGHMAGRYGGLGFEAESTRTGIKIGGAASPPESFARKFHLARGGRIDQELIDLFARSGADIGGDPGKLRINGQVFDRGGTLSPGLNLLANRTGRPEPLVPVGQGGHITVNVTVNGAVGNPHDIARVLAPAIRQEIKQAQRSGGVPAREQLR